MTRTIRPAIALLTALCAIFAFGQAWAAETVSGPTQLAAPKQLSGPDAVEHVGAFGRIDWSTLTVTAVGVGVPPATVRDTAKARLMGERAAILDARRNLLETVKGVRIDSRTTVRDFILQSDEVAASVSGLVQGSVIQKTTPMTDGSWQAIVSMGLTGDLAEAALRPLLETREAPTTARPTPEAETPNADRRVIARLERLDSRLTTLEARLIRLETAMRRQDQRPDPVPRQDDTTRLRGRVAHLEQRLAALEAAPPLTAEEMQETTPGAIQTDTVAPEQPAPAAPPAPLPAYTGLVVDARNMNFSPSLQPRLFGKGRLLYPGPEVDADVAASRGLARFYRDLTRAQRNPDLGDMPLTVRAASLADGADTDLVLADGDADTVARILAAEDNFVTQCKVVVVF